MVYKGIFLFQDEKRNKQIYYYKKFESLYSLKYYYLVFYIEKVMGLI